MMKKSWNTFLLLLALLLGSCSAKKNTIPVKAPATGTTTGSTPPITGGTTGVPSGSSNSPTPTTVPIPGPLSPPAYGDATGSSGTYCNSPGVGSQQFEYYRLPIKGHGVLQGGIMWSSLNYSGQWGQDIFRTDNRLHIRVLVKMNPKTCNLPAGYSPPNWDEPYSKLRLNVAIRAQSQVDGGYFEKIQFTDVKVNECSPVRAFANIPITNDPLVVEIRAVESDFYCLQYQQGKVYGNQYCPYTWIDTKACWEFELHMSTDDTKDIPR